MAFVKDIPLSTQRAFTESLVRLGGKYKNVVVLHGGAAAPLGLAAFDKALPGRSFGFGNATRTMMGAAAGFIARGKIPLVCAYALPVTGKGWDILRNQLASQTLNIKIIGIHSGLLNSEEGATNQALEDISLMRSIPGMKIICPADSQEAQKALEVMLLDYGPAYMRLTHLPLPDLYDKDSSFQLGKASVYKTGSDVCIFAIGTGLHTALDAADALERKGISTMVVNAASVAPLDEGFIVECAKAVDHVVTVEDHQRTGGLGSAICEVLSTHYPAKVLRIGMDGFGESGKVDDLFQKYGLDGVSIAEKIEGWV